VYPRRITASKSDAASAGSSKGSLLVGFSGGLLVPFVRLTTLRLRLIDLLPPLCHKKRCLRHGYNFPSVRIPRPSTRYPTSLSSEDHRASLSKNVSYWLIFPIRLPKAPSKEIFADFSSGSAESTPKVICRVFAGEF
jgi:hypothetical protein